MKNFLLLSTFAAIGFALFSLFPAIIFKYYEGWTYLDSVYFTIITLTTIGFGDFVASRSFRISGFGFCNYENKVFVHTRIIVMLR